MRNLPKTLTMPKLLKTTLLLPTQLNHTMPLHKLKLQLMDNQQDMVQLHNNQFMTPIKATLNNQYNLFKATEVKYLLNLLKAMEVKVIKIKVTKTKIKVTKTKIKVTKIKIKNIKIKIKVIEKIIKILY